MAKEAEDRGITVGPECTCCGGNRSNLGSFQEAVRVFQKETDAYAKWARDEYKEESEWCRAYGGDSWPHYWEDSPHRAWTDGAMKAGALVPRWLPLEEKKAVGILVGHAEGCASTGEWWVNIPLAAKYKEELKAVDLSGLGEDERAYVEAFLSGGEE